MAEQKEVVPQEAKVANVTPEMIAAAPKATVKMPRIAGRLVLKNRTMITTVEGEIVYCDNNLHDPTAKVVIVRTEPAGSFFKAKADSKRMQADGVTPLYRNGDWVKRLSPNTQVSGFSAEVVETDEAAEAKETAKLKAKEESAIRVAKAIMEANKDAKFTIFGN